MPLEVAKLGSRSGGKKPSSLFHEEWLALVLYIATKVQKFRGAMQLSKIRTFSVLERLVKLPLALYVLSHAVTLIDATEINDKI
jgi:hypothetical protein